MDSTGLQLRICGLRRFDGVLGSVSDQLSAVMDQYLTLDVHDVSISESEFDELFIDSETLSKQSFDVPVTVSLRRHWVTLNNTAAAPASKNTQPTPSHS